MGVTYPASQEKFFRMMDGSRVQSQAPVSRAGRGLGAWATGMGEGGAWRAGLVAPGTASVKLI